LIYTVTESILGCGCEIWTVDYRIKNCTEYRNEFWGGKKAARASKMLQVRNVVIRGKKRGV